MAFASRKGKVHEAKAPKHSGGWYADPYGTAARRWYDSISGWSDRVEGAGQAPDKTGLARVDEAALAPEDSTRRVDGDRKPVSLSRPIDPRYMKTLRDDVYGALPGFGEHQSELREVVSSWTSVSFERRRRVVEFVRDQVQLSVPEIAAEREAGPSAAEAPVPITRAR